MRLCTESVERTFARSTRDGDPVKPLRGLEVAVSFMITRTWYQISIRLRLADNERCTDGELAGDSTSRRFASEKIATFFRARETIDASRS